MSLINKNKTQNLKTLHEIFFPSQKQGNRAKLKPSQGYVQEVATLVESKPSQTFAGIIFLQCACSPPDVSLNILNPVLSDA